VFEEFVAGRGQALQRFGYALTGDWALAEDLLQTALARAIRAGHGCSGTTLRRTSARSC
jgi:DNA-directed RNA polymerase specialized sigma24 family protein